MVKRIGFRVLLPSVNLIVFIALSVWGASPPLIACLLQESANVPWTPQNPFYPLLLVPRLVAVAINAPAYFVAASILAVVGVSNLNFMRWLLPVMCPFVVVVWHFTGRWVDRRLEWLPAVPHPKHWTGILRVAAVALGLLAIGSAYGVVYFARGGIAGWHGETPFNAALTYGSTGWLVLWELMLLTAIMRRKNEPNVPVAQSDRR